MKRSAALLIAFVLAVAAVHAQSTHSAMKGDLSISAGALGSAFQPDYAGSGSAQVSPNRLYGIGAFVDIRFNRWVQLETEGRWLTFNQFNQVSESNYLAGPRLPIRRIGRFTPYGKVLFGFSSSSFLVGRSSTLVYGGGVDYRLSKKFSLRAADFEYQHWSINNAATTDVRPYGLSAGLSYRIF